MCLLGCNMKGWQTLSAIPPKGWSVCPHCADIKCKSCYSVGIGIGLKHLKFCGHMRELPLPGFKATALQTQLWKLHFWKSQGPTLISEGTSGSRIALISHRVSVIYLFPVSSGQHCKGWTVCSTLLSLAITLQPAQVFVSVLFCNNLLDWKLFGTRIQLPNALTSKHHLGTALRNPKSSRSQTIRLKQHYDSEAEVIYLGLFLFTQ